MNILPSSASPLVAAGGKAQPGRDDAPAAGEPGSFADLLGQRLEATVDRPVPQAAGAASPKRAPRLQEPGEREAIEASPLPLLAAALLDRMPQAGSGAAVAAVKPDAARLEAADGGEPVARSVAPPRDGPGAKPEPLPAAQPKEGAMPAFADLRDDHASTQVPASAPTPAPSRPREAVAAQAASGLREAAPEDGSTEPAAPAASARRSAAPAVGITLPDTAREGDDSIAGGHRAASEAPAPMATPATATPPAVQAPLEPRQADPATPARGFVGPPVASRAWAPALGHELARIHQTGHIQAQLELNPPGLGPLSVTLSVADQQATALFASPHAAVRAALEAALPQLRTALAENGISLGQASVGSEQQPGSGAFAQQDPSHQRRPGAPAPVSVPVTPAAAAPAPRRTGGHAVDTFA